jgi:hypothetical protein
MGGNAMSDPNETPCVTRVRVPASVSVIVIDGTVREVELTLGDGPFQMGEFRVFTPSGDDAADDAALKAADGYWDLPWGEVPAWLSISS